MSLAERLDRLRARRSGMPAAVRATIEAALERQRMLQLAEDAPMVGESFPDFALEDPDGRIWRSDELLGAGPLFVLFFRGGWCPYCGATLRAVDGVAAQLADLGVGLVGILPEGCATLAATRRAIGPRFPLLSDAGGRLARLAGLSCALTADQIALYGERQGLDLPARHAGTGWELPVPGVFLLRPDGTIAFAFVEPDYTRRAEPADLIEAARRLLAEAD